MLLSELLKKTKENSDEFKEIVKSFIAGCKMLNLHDDKCDQDKNYEERCKQKRIKMDD